AAPSEPPSGTAAAVALTTETSASQPASAVASLAPTEPPAGRVPATAPIAAIPSSDTAAAPSPADPPAVESRLSPTEIAALLSRGDMLFSTGDLAAARLFYERAADAGDAQAAVRLGETFDPIFLDHSRLRGVRGDAEAALSWYRRA